MHLLRKKWTFSIIKKTKNKIKKKTKNTEKNKASGAHVVTTKGCALNHDTTLLLLSKATSRSKNDFLKDVESRIR